MKELRAIIAAAGAAPGPMALATVVSVEGSSYRRPGARMIVTPEGAVAGSVSGGCLEADVTEHARAVIDTGEARLVTYDTREEDDAVFGLGTGCAGVIEILVERVALDHVSLALPASWIGRREPAVLATILTDSEAARIGDRLLISTDGYIAGSVTDQTVQEAITHAARTTLVAGVSKTLTLVTGTKPIRVFLELLKPPLSLVLYGAGTDALPLVRIAKELGWQVTVADHRPHYVTSTRFPLADSVIVAHPSDLAEQITLDAQTAVVVMTHNYQLDLSFLTALSDAPIAYLGLLGSRQRTERILNEIGASSAADTMTLQHLHAPIGLDLGAATPDEIALSIIAEIQAVLSGRSGGSLRDQSNLSGDKMPRFAVASRGTRSCAIAG